MYKFSYYSDHLERMITDRKIFWDSELEEELGPVLSKLKQTSEVAGANCGFNLIALGKIYYTLPGQTFQLAYTVDSDKLIPSIQIRKRYGFMNSNKSLTK